MSSDVSRQTRLREVGRKGQELISAARVVVGSDTASGVAAEYLTRSAVGSVVQEGSHTPEPFPHAEHFTYPVTAQFARGAWLATRTIVGLLGIRHEKPGEPT